MLLDNDCGCIWCFNDPSEKCNSCWEACMNCQEKFYVEEGDFNGRSDS